MTFLNKIGLALRPMALPLSLLLLGCQTVYEKGPIGLVDVNSSGMSVLKHRHPEAATVRSYGAKFYSSFTFGHENGTVYELGVKPHAGGYALNLYRATVFKATDKITGQDVELIAQSCTALNPRALSRQHAYVRDDQGQPSPLDTKLSP